MNRKRESTAQEGGSAAKVPRPAPPPAQLEVVSNLSALRPMPTLQGGLPDGIHLTQEQTPQRLHTLSASETIYYLCEEAPWYMQSIASHKPGVGATFDFAEGAPKLQPRYKTLFLVAHFLDACVLPFVEPSITKYDDDRSHPMAHDWLTPHPKRVCAALRRLADPDFSADRVSAAFNRYLFSYSGETQRWALGVPSQMNAGIYLKDATESEVFSSSFFTDQLPLLLSPAMRAVLKDNLLDHPLFLPKPLSGLSSSLPWMYTGGTGIAGFHYEDGGNLPFFNLLMALAFTAHPDEALGGVPVLLLLRALTNVTGTKAWVMAPIGGAADAVALNSVIAKAMGFPPATATGGDALLRARIFHPADAFVKRHGWTVVHQRPGQLLRSDWAHAVSGVSSFSVAWNALPAAAVGRCVQFECDLADSIAAATPPAALACWAKGGARPLLPPDATARSFSTSLFLNRAIARFSAAARHANALFASGALRSCDAVQAFALFETLRQAMEVLAAYNARRACTLPLRDLGKVVGYTDSFSCDICTFAGCSYMVADGARLAAEEGEAPVPSAPEGGPLVALLCGRCFTPRAARLAGWERVNTGTATLQLLECGAVPDNVLGVPPPPV